MSLRHNIQRVLAILEKAVSQAPIDKQPLLNSKLSRVLQKHQKPQTDQAAFLKQLEFNLNFIKLSFPHLDYSPPTPAQAKNQVNERTVKEEFIELENKEQVLQFVQDTEKLIKGVREEVEFVNWGAGNIDPQDLKRHKDLLKRQYFAGQFWQGKERPVSPTAAYLQNIMQNQPQLKHQKIVVQPGPAPAFAHDPDQNWEKVKR